MKKNLLLTIICFSTLNACSDPQWTEQSYIERFNQVCNSNNSPHVKGFCQCQLASAKASYPNPDKFFALDGEALRVFNSESFKQCVDWDLLGHEIRKQCEASVGRNQTIDCKCNIAKLKAAIPEAAKYTDLTKEAKHQAAMKAAMECAKEKALPKSK